MSTRATRSTSSHNSHSLASTQRQQPTGYEPSGSAEASSNENSDSEGDPTGSGGEEEKDRTGDESESSSIQGTNPQLTVVLESIAKLVQSNTQGTQAALESIGKLLQSNSQGSSHSVRGGYSPYADALSKAMIQLPTLKGVTPKDYNEWAESSLSILQSAGLKELVLMKPIDSLNKVIRSAGENPTAIENNKQQWVQAHGRVVGAIRTATSKAIGKELFVELNKAQTAVGIFDVLEPSLDLSQLELRFIADNAYLLWDRLKKKLHRYSQYHVAAMVNKLFQFKYEYGSDPTESRKLFFDAINELENAGVVMVPRILATIWFNAIPKELESLKQILGEKEEYTWQDTYESLVRNYEQRAGVLNSGAPIKESARMVRTADQDNDDETPNKRPKVQCSHCNKPNHSSDRCWTKHPELKPAQSNFNGRGRKFLRGRGALKNTTRGGSKKVYAALCITDEEGIADGLGLHDDENSECDSERESVNLSTESNNNSADKKKEPFFFIFDSAATTHITGNRRLLTAINKVPEIEMHTAIKGATTIIRERGEVVMNPKWTLRHVAYVNKASSNLLSEGRLTDAGFHIYKNKYKVIVRAPKEDNPEEAGEIALVGYRWNRLWVWCSDGKPPASHSTNTLINSRKRRIATASSSSSTSTSSSSSASSSAAKRPATAKAAMFVPGGMCESPTDGTTEGH